MAFFAGTARAQPPNRGAPRFDPDWSVPAEKLLRSAADHVRGKQWSEALLMYQKVIEQYGNKVAALPADEPGVDPTGEFVLYVDDRRYCHRAIAKLPREAREIYRKRIDAVAERWFRQGESQRDPALLRRVIDQAFCSSWGDDALELLGDLAFQDGRFGEALASYDRLVADDPDQPFTLVHPDPSVDLAKVAAKKLLCRAAAGENPPAAGDLEAFGKRFPGASGSLAGRTGAFSEILADSLRSDHLAQALEPDNRWPTFAGSFQRSRVVSGPIDVGSMQWRVDLEKVSLVRMPGFNPRAGMGPGSVSAPPERLLAFHPIVLGDQVIVCDGSRILAFNLNDRPSGAETSAVRVVGPVWKYPPDDDAQVPQARQIHPGFPRYTLTAVGNRIYARMGSQSAAYLSGMGARAASSSIVALDWSTQGKLLWEQRSTALTLPDRPADRNNNRTISFEGTPVADGRNVYTAVTDRRELTHTYIVCFDADSGATRWVRYVGAASPDGDNNLGFGGGMQVNVTSPGDFNHRLLSLDGPTLFYQTNLGALAAIEAETGSTLWVASYPRHEPSQFGNGSERDLNPAVIHQGRVMVAPSDADAVFAFDEASGRLLWKTDRIADDIKLSHLLGVSKGRLVATGNRVLLYDVKTGKLLHAWPDSGKLEGHGRGLLAGDSIYWPTQNEIQVLDQRTGLRAEPPIKLLETYHAKGGNLVAGDGYLIVAQSDGLVVFCQNSRLIQRYREQIALAPAQAANYFRLARAAEAIGRDQLALEMYGKATEKARGNETIDGVPLSGAARDQRFRLLVRLAATARRAGEWDLAAAGLESAGAVARSGSERLQAQLLLADVLLDASRPRDAVAICERLLGDERLRTLPVAAADGHRTVRADLLIADRLSAIVREHGRGIYQTYDKEAARLLERGKKEQDPRLLDEVCRAYPEARVIPDALLELGLLYERSKRLNDASNTYKRLGAVAPDDDRRVLALWRLAHVYEARQLLLSARDSYLELLARFPKKELEDQDRKAQVSVLVRAELARPLYASIVAEGPQPPTPLPLLRRWHWQPPARVPLRTIAAQGVVPSLDAGRVFLVEKTGLRLLDPRTGAPRWSADLGAPAVWAGYLADKLIVATARQVVGLELSEGSVQWRFDASGSGKDAARPDPFANPAEAGDRREPAGQSLSGFQLAKGRVFCLRNRNELIALDGDTGAVDWSFKSPPGEINPNLWIGAEWAVLQVDKPNQLLVLRSDDGRPVSRAALAEKELLERPPVPLDENSVLLVSDRRTVKRFDLIHGQTSWVYQESKDLPVNGPPRILGDAEHVLVLHDGRLLIRLDPATGLKRWECLLGIEDLSERPDAMACDQQTFYCVNFENVFGTMRQTIRAVALGDGSRVWACPLAGPQDAVWSIALTERAVIAYPSATRYSEGGDAANMPVIVRRREGGGLIERFVFPSSISGVTFKVDPRGAVLATSKGIWALSSKLE